MARKNGENRGIRELPRDRESGGSTFGMKEKELEKKSAANPRPMQPITD